MTEKITIFELDIDVGASKNDLEESRLAVNELTKALKELKDAENENNKKLDEQKNKLKELQSAKKQDIKAIADTQSKIDKLLVKRTDLNKSIVNQTTVLKVNQNELRENQKVIQNSITISQGYNRKLEEEKIKQQQLTSERKKVIREGIKLANEAKELTVLQNKKNRSEAENIRLNNLLVKQRKNLVVNSKATRKEYNRLTVSIANNNKQLLKNDKSIGRFQRNVGNYTNQLRGLVGALGITGGVAAIGQLLSKSTQAYKEQVIEVAKLTTVLRERTNATDAEIQSVLNLTTAEQRRGIIGDEIQTAGAQQIATFVEQTESVKTLIPALNNLLAQQKGVNATQQDAVGIGNLIGKVLQGETTALKRVGITFTETQNKILKFGNESERSATLAQVITDNVGEMNEALAQTDAGKLKNVENNLGDIEEQIGKAILPSLSAWKTLQLEIIQGLIGIAKGYDILGFAAAKTNIKQFVDENKLLTVQEKRTAGVNKYIENQKELNKLQEEYKDLRIQDRTKAENKALNDKIQTLKSEQKLLAALKNQGFFDKQFQEKKIERNKEETKTDKESEKQKAINSKNELKRIKEEEAIKDKAAKAEIERKKKAAEAAFTEFQRLRDLEKQRKAFTAQARQELIDQEKERQITDQENELALLEGDILTELQAERIGLESKRLLEIEFAEKIGADTTLIEQKFAKAREEINRAETEAKLSLAADFAGNIAVIAGKGTAIGKAAAVAATVISTYMSATGAFASMTAPPVAGPFSLALGFAAAGAAVAAGLANVRKILSVKSGLPGDTGGGGGSIPSASSASSRPTGVSQRPGSIAPEINQGIIARGLPITNQRIKQPSTAVIIDEVTAKQIQQSSNSETSVV